MAKTRKAVINFTIKGRIVIDLKDSASVLTASKTIEALTAEAKAANVIDIETSESFGNADIEDAAE